MIPLKKKISILIIGIIMQSLYLTWRNKSHLNAKNVYARKKNVNTRPMF